MVAIVRVNVVALDLGYPLTVALSITLSITVSWG